MGTSPSKDFTQIWVLVRWIIRLISVRKRNRGIIGLIRFWIRFFQNWKWFNISDRGKENHLGEIEARDDVFQSREQRILESGGTIRHRESDAKHNTGDIEDGIQGFWEGQILENLTINKSNIWDSYGDGEFRYKRISLGTFLIIGSHSYNQKGLGIHLRINQLRMSQGKLVKREGDAGRMEGSLKRLKIKVPHFDNSDLIAGYSKTLIGRCMNPKKQDMKALLHMLPRILNVEERVAAADLGMGRFQFDFDREEDITEVLRLGPFHFDYWMLSLVRWAPVVDSQYPSEIKFWVRVMGVPLHYWADQTFRSIGEALGDVKEVDLDGGRVQVVLNGFKPLSFETAVEFHGGEETIISLRYERLFGYCRICSSMCHDSAVCDRREGMADLQDSHIEDKTQGRKALSYKGATMQGKGDGLNHRQSDVPIRQHYGQDKGKGKADSRGVDTQNYSGREHWSGPWKGYKPPNSSRYVHPKDLDKRFVIPTTGLQELVTSDVGNHLSHQERLMLEAFQSNNPDPSKVSLADSAVKNKDEAEIAEVGKSKNVRRSILFHNEGNDLAKEETTQGALSEITSDPERVGQEAEKQLVQDDGIDDSEEGTFDGMIEDIGIDIATGDPIQAGSVSVGVEEDHNGTALEKEHHKFTDEIPGEGEIKIMPKKKPAAKFKANLTGAGSKKRLVQSIISPRRTASINQKSAVGRVTSNPKTELVNSVPE